VKGRGTQFDPVIVDALLACYREGKITRIIQESLKDSKSIVCPFCSTFISIPDGANEGDCFRCPVCHRTVQLKQQNNAYYGELLAETS
jgi:transposase-like protein